jgi:PAS domain S-box-containing protein
LVKLLKKSEEYYQSIPADDLISRQRYRLFRTTTITAGLVILYAFIQAFYVLDVGNFSSILIGFLDLVLIVNFFSLPYHRNHKLAYYVIVLAAFTTLHVISYYSGGIRASAVMYMVGNMLLAFMLLGNKAGRIMFGLIALNLAYFWYLTENTTLISYSLIGESKDLINFDYLTTFLLAMLILSAQMNYLESGKNIVIQRITEQRNELREKNRELNKLSIVASKADNAITITDENGTSEWVNDGFVRLTGYSVAEAVGRNPLDYLYGSSGLQSGLQELRTAISSHQPFSGELLKYRKDGTPFWTQVTMTPIRTEEEQREQFIFIESDITPRKIAEQKMASYMKNLEKTNQELDKFAYVVSHDLKAPLRAIGNLTGWIEEDMGERLTDEVRTHFNTIKGRVVRMEGLINGILDYTKAAKNGGELISFRSDQLVRDSVELIGAPPTAVIHIRDNMPVLKSEPVKLQQIFMNLLHNAIKYNDKEDVQIEVGCEEEQTHWKFYVKDNGPGIEARYHEKIFVIFQTLQARDEVESRGVGLAIVKKIIEEEGGRIWVESEKGKGATFFFTWPKVKKREPEEVVFSDAELF